MPLAAAIALLTLQLAGGGAPPSGGPVRVAWSTYLRSGAGEGFSVVDEVVHDTRVTLVSCSTGWCRVSDEQVSGFIDRDALDLPRASAVSPSSACATAWQADQGASGQTRFCPTR